MFLFNLIFDLFSLTSTGQPFRRTTFHSVGADGLSFCATRIWKPALKTFIIVNQLDFGHDFRSPLGESMSF
ncbi:MAG: hypothetical protein C5B58_09635 [Acidobacteria bacterium]|nr:MAG: hypothetical protein C5B58_09635 [Acidobacteriota bacterium]